MSSEFENLLARVPLFGNFDGDDLRRIARETRDVRAEKGDILVRRGEPASGFHLILSGQIKLGFTSSQGNEKLIDIMGPGQTFGEAVMFMDKPYPVFAQALVPSRLLHIGRRAILEGIENDPRFACRMIAALSMRLHHLVTDVEASSLHSGRQRIIGYLLRDESPAAGNGGVLSLTVSLPASKGTIASRLNLTQEHFSRILHELVEAGLIAVNGRRITIPDVEKLRGYGF